jgi:hypothetical protein
MNWALFAAAGELLWIVLYMIKLVGVPREPIEPGAAALAVVLTGWIVVVITIVGWRMTTL